MIRENQKYLNFLLILIDMMVVTFALFFAWFIRFKTTILGIGVDNWHLNQYLISLTFILVVYTILNYFFGLYSPHRTDNITSEIKQILKINIIGLLVLVTTLTLIEVDDYSRYLLAMFAIFSTTFMITERFLFRSSLRYVRGKGFNIQYILVIGAGDLGEKFANKIDQNYYIGYKIVGFLDDYILKGQKISNSEVIGSIKDLEHIILNNIVDIAIITISARHYQLIESIVNTLEKHGVKAEIVPDFYRYFSAKPAIDMIDDIPVINIRYVPLDNNFNKFLKRIGDIFLAVIGHYCNITHPSCNCNIG